MATMGHLLCRRQYRACLQRLDIRRMLALWPLLHLEAHALIFLQGLEALRLDLGEMRKQVLAPVVWRNMSSTK
jgi:hypothetical protein